MAMLAENLNMKSGRSSGAMTRIVWITSLRPKNRSAEWSQMALLASGANDFLVAAVGKPAAAAGGGQNHGEFGHVGVSHSCITCPPHCAVLRPSVKSGGKRCEYEVV